MDHRVEMGFLVWLAWLILVELSELEASIMTGGPILFANRDYSHEGPEENQHKIEKKIVHISIIKTSPGRGNCFVVDHQLGIPLEKRRWRMNEDLIAVDQSPVRPELGGRPVLK